MQIDQAYLMNNQQSKVITQQTVTDATDYYKRLTEELNKCFDDIELFVRYLEALTEYAKELERDHRRKDKRSPSSFDDFFSTVSFIVFSSLCSGLKKYDRQTSG